MVSSNRNFQQELELILKGDVTDAVAKLRVLSAETRQAMSSMRADVARVSEVYRDVNKGYAQAINDIQQIQGKIRETGTALEQQLKKYDRILGDVASKLNTDLKAAADKTAGDLKALDVAFATNEANAKRVRDGLVNAMQEASKAVQRFNQDLISAEGKARQETASLTEEIGKAEAKATTLQKSLTDAFTGAVESAAKYQRQILSNKASIEQLEVAVTRLKAAEDKAKAAAAAAESVKKNNNSVENEAAYQKAQEAATNAVKLREAAETRLNAAVMRRTELTSNLQKANQQAEESLRQAVAATEAEEKARASREAQRAAQAVQHAEQRRAVLALIASAQDALKDAEQRAAVFAVQHHQTWVAQQQQRRALENQGAQEQQRLAEEAAQGLERYAQEYTEIQAKIKQYRTALDEAEAKEVQLRAAQHAHAQQATADIAQQREAHRKLEAITQQVTAESAKMSLAIRQGNASTLRSYQTLLGPLGAMLQPIIDLHTRTTRVNAAMVGLNPVIANVAKTLGTIGAVGSTSFAVVAGGISGLTTVVNTFLNTAGRIGQTYKSWAVEAGTTATELRTLQEITGMNVREAGALQAAFTALGQPAFIVNAALASLNVAAGKNEETFRRMNVAIREEGTNALLPTRDILLSMADAYEKAGNKQEATANIGQVFSGWMAGSMIPILALGRKGIEDLTRYMEQLGLSMDEVSRDRAVAAKTAFQMLGLQVDALKRAIVVGLAPAVVTALLAIVELTPKITAGLSMVTASINALFGGVLKGLGVEISQKSRDVVVALSQVVGAGQELQETFGGESAKTELLKNDLANLTRAHRADKDAIDSSADAVKGRIKDYKGMQDAAIDLAEKGLRNLRNELKALNTDAKNALAPFKQDVVDATKTLEDARGKLTNLQRTRTAERIPLEGQKDSLSVELASANEHLKNMERLRAGAFLQIDKDITSARENVGKFKTALDELKDAQTADLDPMKDDLERIRGLLKGVETQTRLVNQQIAAQKKPWQDVIDTSTLAIRDLREAHEEQIAATKAGLESMRNFIAELKEQEQALLAGVDKTINKIRQSLEKLEDQEKQALKPLKDQLELYNDQLEMLRDQADADESAIEARVAELQRQQREARQALAAQERHPESTTPVDDAALERAQRMAEIIGELATAQNALAAAQATLARDFQGELDSLQRSIDLDKQRLQLMEAQNQETQRARQMKQAELALADLLGESELGRLKKEREALNESEKLHRNQGESRSAFNKRKQAQNLDDQIKAIELQRQIEAAKQVVQDQKDQQAFEALRKDLQERIAQETTAADAIRQAWQDARTAQAEAQRQISTLTKEQAQLQKDLAKEIKASTIAAQDEIASIQDLKDAEVDRLTAAKAAHESQIKALEAHIKDTERSIRTTERLYSTQREGIEADLQKQESARKSIQESYGAWVNAVQVQAIAAEKSINQSEAALNAKIRPIETAITDARRNLEAVDKEWAPTLLHLQNLRTQFDNGAQAAEQRITQREAYWRPRITQAQKDYDEAQGKLSALEIDRQRLTQQWDAWMAQPKAQVAELHTELDALDAKLAAIELAYKPLLLAAQQDVDDAEAKLNIAQTSLHNYEAEWDKLRDTKQGEIDAKNEEIAGLREERDEVLKPLEQELRDIQDHLDAIDKQYNARRTQLEEDIQAQTNAYSNFKTAAAGMPQFIEDLARKSRQSLQKLIFGDEEELTPEAATNAAGLDPNAVQSGATQAAANMDPTVRKWRELGQNIGKFIREGLVLDEGWVAAGKSIGVKIAEGIAQGLKATLDVLARWQLGKTNELLNEVLPGSPLQTTVPAHLQPSDPRATDPGLIGGTQRAFGDLWGGVKDFGGSLADAAASAFRSVFGKDPETNKTEHEKTYDSWSTQSSTLAQASIKKLFAEPVSKGTTDVFQSSLGTGLAAVTSPDEAFRTLVATVGSANDRAFLAGKPGMSEDIKATITGSVIGGTDDTTAQLGRGFHDKRFSNLADALRDQTVSQFGDVAKSTDKDTGLRGGWSDLLLNAIMGATEDTVNRIGDNAELGDASHLGGLAKRYSNKVSEIFRTAFTGIKPEAVSEINVPMPGITTAPMAAAVDPESDALQHVIRDMLVNSLTAATEDATKAVPEKVGAAAVAFAKAIADQVQEKLNNATTPVLEKFKTDLTTWWNDGVVHFLEGAKPWNETIANNWTAEYKDKIQAILDSIVAASGDTSSGTIPQWNTGLLSYLTAKQKPWDAVSVNWDAYRDHIGGEGGILSQISAQIQSWMGSAGANGAGLLGALAGLDPWAAVEPKFTAFESNAFATFHRMNGIGDGGTKGIPSYAEDIVSGIGTAFNGLWDAARPGFDALATNAHATIVTVAGMVNELGRQLLGTEQILDVAGIPAPSTPSGGGGGGGGGGGSSSHGNLTVAAGNGGAVGGPMVDGALGALSLPTISVNEPQGSLRALPASDADIRKLISQNYEYIAKNSEEFRPYLDDTTAGAAALWGKAAEKVGYQGKAASPVVEQLTGGAAMALSLSGQGQVKRWLDILAATFGDEIWEWPVHGTLEQEFGFTDYAKGRYANDMHTGVDLGVPSNTPVRAPFGGKVIAVRDDGSAGYGYHVMVEHTPDLVSLFAHMSRGSAKPVGTVLGQGDVLGLSDNTGNSTGPHLHWEVLENGKWVDPIQRIAGTQLTTTGNAIPSYGVNDATPYRKVVVPPGVNKNAWILQEYGYNHFSAEDLSRTVADDYPPPPWFTRALFSVNERYRLTPRQLRSLATLSWLESDYTLGVDNVARSGAKGLFQLMPFNREAYDVKDYDPESEIEGGIRYILGRGAQQGGSPTGSLNFWLNNGWYRNGGLAGLRGPELAEIGHGPEFVLDATTTAALKHQGLISMRTGGAQQVAPEFVEAIRSGQVARSISTTYNSPSNAVNNSMTLHYQTVHRPELTPAQEHAYAELQLRRMANLMRG